MKYYTLDRLERIYRREFPDMADAEIEAKAKELHKLLNAMDVAWRRSNRRFYGKSELIGI